MDVLTFSAALISSLAWPVAVVVGLALFHRRISALLDTLAKKLVKARLPGVELEFDRIAEAAREVEAEQAHQGGRAASRIPIEAATTVRFEELARNSPTGAVLDSWARVEASLRASAKRRGIPTRGPVGTVLRSLAQEEVIDSPTEALLRGVQGLRNMVAHGERQDIPFGDALEIQSIAEKLTRILDAT